MSTRDDAWRLLHDPATRPETLQRIAAAHPDFAAAVAAHPNCYPELRSWASAQAAGEGAGRQAAGPPQGRTAGEPLLPPPAERGSRTKVAAILVGVAAVFAVVFGCAVWAAVVFGTRDGDEQAAPTPSSSASDAVSAMPDGEALPPAAVMGPTVFTGTDLDGILPSDDEILALFTDVEDLERSYEYGSVGETEGFVGEPRACGPLVFDDFSVISGFRRVSWRPGVEFHTGFTFTVTQLPTVEYAQRVYARWTAAGEQCAQYRFRDDQPLPVLGFTVDDTLERGHTSLLYGTITELAADPQAPFPSGRFVMTAQHGNVIVEFSGPPQVDAAQAEAVAQLIADRLDAAREQVGAELGLPTG